jgi:hypothetical protein
MSKNVVEPAKPVLHGNNHFCLLLTRDVTLSELAGGYAGHLFECASKVRLISETIVEGNLAQGRLERRIVSQAELMRSRRM